MRGMRISDAYANGVYPGRLALVQDAGDLMRQMGTHLYRNRMRRGAQETAPAHSLSLVVRLPAIPACVHAPSAGPACAGGKR